MNSQQSSPRRRSYWGCFFSLLLVAIVVASLMLSCPTRHDHQHTIADVVTSVAADVIDEKLASEDGTIGRKLQQMGDVVIASVVSEGIDDHLVVSDYGVCSVGFLTFAGKKQPVSVGIMGHVCTVPKSQVRLFADKYIKQAEEKIDRELRQQLNEKIAVPVREMLKKKVPEELLDLLRELSTAPSDDEEAEE